MYLLCCTLYPLICPINGSLYLLRAFVEFPFLPPPASGKHKSNLFSELFVCFWNIIDRKHYVSSCYRIWWFSISIHFKMITMVSLVTICHHTKILHNYWLFSPRCTFHAWLSCFATANLYLLISLTSLSSTGVSSALATTFLSSISVSVLLSLFICFLDSTYKWNHTGFVFPCLTYFI